MSDVVLDASALLALVNDEPGAARVADVLAHTRISAFNFAEVVSHFVHAGMATAAIDAMLSPLPIEVVPLDDGQSHIAERLRKVLAAAGLPEGALSCLALAQRDGLPVMTADKLWRLIAGEADVAIQVIR